MKLKRQILLGTILGIMVGSTTQSLAEEPIENPLIDTPGFVRMSNEAVALREQRRITEDRFVEMAQDKATLILDMRSAEKFKKMHIAGAKHINFSDITEDSLAEIIPSKDTRILIYCNNNIENEPVAFPAKAIQAPLNLPSFITLYTYGYNNIYELGPVVDPKTSRITFEGSCGIQCS